jgi:hypothetical protein
MRVSRGMVMAAAGLCLSMATGCSTALKQAVAEVRGARAEIELLQTVPVAQPAARVKFRPARAETPHPGVAGMVSAFDRSYAKVEEEFNGHEEATGPTIEIDMRVMYYKAKGVFDSALMLARTQAFDSGQLVLDAIVRTESKSFRASDPEDIAEKSAEAVATAVTGRKKKLFGRDGDSKRDD